MKIKLLTVCSNLLLALALFPLTGLAQERPAKASLMLELAGSATRDTYLTPLQYNGTDIGVRYERQRTMRGGVWQNFQAIDADFASADAYPDKNSSMWVGRAKYSYAMHCPILASAVEVVNSRFKKEHLSLLFGPYTSIESGFNYNLKIANGNNPGTVRLAANAGASLLAIIKEKYCTMELLVQTPLLGTAFMPEFGQSYYEAFFVDDDFKGMHFTSLHNQRDLDLRMNFDVPLAVIPWFKKSRRVVRLGFYTHTESMKINRIVTKHMTAGLTIGWTWKYLPL